jgi:tetratricopeptide (TPR) repeat protein
MPEASNPSSGNPPDPSAAAPPAARPAPLAPTPRLYPPNSHSVLQQQQILQLQQLQQLQQAAPNVNFSELVALAKKLAKGGEVEEPSPKADATKPDSSHAGRAHIAKEQRKFHRQENASDLAESPDDKGAADSTNPVDAGTSKKETPLLTFDHPTVGFREFTAPASLKLKRNRRAKWSRQKTLLAFAATQLAIIALVVGGYGFWRAIRLPPPPPIADPAPDAPSASPGMTAALSARAAELVDQIANAEKAGNLSKALALCKQFQSEKLHAMGFDYKEGQLAAAADDTARAMLALNRSLALRENVAEARFLRVMLMQPREQGPTLQEYEMAAQAEPFNAKAFFFWGEALRRAGKLQEAVGRLKQAVDRVRNPLDEALYRLKIRLTLIELKQDSEFADELRTNLESPSPAPDWLLTAAAQHMHRGEFAAAVPFLKRFTESLPREEIVKRFRDFFLAGFASQKEIAPFYEPYAEVAPAIFPASPNYPSPTASPTPL